MLFGISGKEFVSFACIRYVFFNAKRAIAILVVMDFSRHGLIDGEKKKRMEKERKMCGKKDTWRNQVFVLCFFKGEKKDTWRKKIYFFLSVIMF